jgi:hypothetical protein
MHQLGTTLLLTLAVVAGTAMLFAANATAGKGAAKQIKGAAKAAVDKVVGDAKLQAAR